MAHVLIDALSNEDVLGLLLVSNLVRKVVLGGEECGDPDHRAAEREHEADERLKGLTNARLESGIRWAKAS